MRSRALILVLLCLACWPGISLARPLVSDLSQHVIAIDSRFRGMDILLFGAKNSPGEIVVVVRGPEVDVTIRKKERVLGLWVNRSSVRLEDVPAYYYMVSTRSLPEMEENQSLLGALEVGLNSAIPTPLGVTSDPFRDAWMRNRLAARLYQQGSSPISFMGETLFKTVIPFPDNIPRGSYTAEIYLVDDGQLIGVQSTPLVVDKQGLDAMIYDFAHNHALAYGVLAIIIALIGGWLAGVIFRKA